MTVVDRLQILLLKKRGDRSRNDMRGWDGEGAARYDLRVLVMDQVPYGPYVPVRQPVVLPFIQVCHTYAAPARIFITGITGVIHLGALYCLAILRSLFINSLWFQ